MNTTKIMITGTGRCGTRLLYDTLRGLGLDLGLHERSIGKHGGGLNFGWNRFVTSTRFAPEGYTQICVVRDPLNCIASLTTAANGKGPYNKANEFFKVELQSGKSALHRAMIFYYYVNKYLYNINSDMLFRIEDLNKLKTQEHLCELLPGITPANLKLELAKYGTNHNTRKHGKYTWVDLEEQDDALAAKIDSLSKKLGY